MNENERKKFLKWFKRLESRNVTNILRGKLYLRISYYLRIGENLTDLKAFNKNSMVKVI